MFFITITKILIIRYFFNASKARCGFSADSGGRKRGFRSRPIGGGDGGGEGEAGRDELAQSLEDLFINVYTMIEGELQVPCLVVSSIPFHDVTCGCLVTESALFWINFFLNPRIVVCYIHKFCFFLNFPCDLVVWESGWPWQKDVLRVVVFDCCEFMWINVLVSFLSSIHVEHTFKDYRRETDCIECKMEVTLPENNIGNIIRDHFGIGNKHNVVH